MIVEHFSGPTDADTSHVLEPILGALILVLVAPVLIMIAAAIAFDSGFPILFWQRRLGAGGRPFFMCKFRKFGAHCGTDGCPLTMRHDARLTRVGRLLEKAKLDELPQLWNIARGEMSFVGPRPESMAFADCFVGEFGRVLTYRPGILGPSQVAFRDEASFYPDNSDPVSFYRAVLFPRKARIDLAYYATRTWRSDLIWILRTIMAVLVSSRPPRLEKDDQHAEPTTLSRRA